MRLALLLTLAVLPMGIIALIQSREVSAQAREMSERALLSEAIRVAAAQRAVIRTAQGQARALVPLLRTAGGSGPACSALMAQVVQAAEGIDFAGFAKPGGQLHCSSDPAIGELPLSIATSLADGRSSLRSGQTLPPLPSTLVVVQPVYGSVPTEAGIASENARFGTVVLGLPERALFTSDAIAGTEPAAVDLATMNRAGEVLWTSPFAPGTIVGPAEAALAERLPETLAEGEQATGELADRPAHIVSARTGGGERRLYAAVPVVEGEIVTLASWQPGSLFDDPGAGALGLSVLLPLAMWLLSLTVAYLTVTRLILRPLGALQSRMKAFTDGERMLPPLRQEGAPNELMDLADTFDAMTDRIAKDETRLEKAVHDQDVLLKEVHHRVKNNLQLIASILNMQLRQHRTPENRAVLRRVQERVTSLATVHQHLYRTSSLSTLRADAMLSEIVNRKLADAGPVASEISVQTQFAPVQLYPDQAVPLALLVGEAVTNVFHHVGRPADGQAPWMLVTLEEASNGRVILEIANSSGVRLTDMQSEFRAGLGTRLIEAFSQQLEGTLERDMGDGTQWQLRLTFRPLGFEAHPSGAAETPAPAHTPEADSGAAPAGPPEPEPAPPPTT